MKNYGEGTRDRLVLCGQAAIVALQLNQGCSPSEIEDEVSRLQADLQTVTQDAHRLADELEWREATETEEESYG